MINLQRVIVRYVVRLIESGPNTLCHSKVRAKQLYDLSICYYCSDLFAAAIVSTAWTSESDQSVELLGASCMMETFIGQNAPSRTHADQLKG